MATTPTEIDEYKIVRALGRGGMGAVFLARGRVARSAAAPDRAGPGPRDHQDTDPATGDVLLLRAGHVARLDPERPVSGRPAPVALIATTL